MNAGGWHQQKAATLAGVADYSYWQHDYDDNNRIPTEVFAQGFSADNLSQYNAYGSSAAAPNVLPRNAQGLYAPHADGNVDGYASMSDDFINMDYAPFLRKEKNMQWGILQTMHNREPIGTYVNKHAPVIASNAVLRDPGNAIGTLTIAPSPGMGDQGKMAGFFLPTNFFATHK